MANNKPCALTELQSGSPFACGYIMIIHACMVSITNVAIAYVCMYDWQGQSQSFSDLTTIMSEPHIQITA